MNRVAARQLAALAAFLIALATVPAGADDPAPADSAPAVSGSPGTPKPAEPGSPAGQPAVANGNAASTPNEDARGTKDAAAAGDAAARKKNGAGAGDTPEPRHGARSKASDGTLLVYDKVVGAYRTTGHDATYWIDDRFWRFDDGAWTSAATNAGPWQAVSAQVVPSAARHQHGDPKSATTIVLPSGREAIFEPRLKAHKVLGRKGVFLFDGGYYRYDNGVWFESQSDDGPWSPTSAKPLPPPLKRALPAPVHGDKVVMPSGETLVYDANSRLYAVEGRPATVYFDGAFYERREERWLRSAESASDVEPVEVTVVPVPVRAKYHTPAGGKKAASKKASQGKGSTPKKDAAAKKNAASKKSADGTKRQGQAAKPAAAADPAAKQADEPAANAAPAPNEAKDSSSPAGD